MVFENLEDGKISFDNNSVGLIDRYIKKFKPNIIITHYTNVDGSSAHQDHHNTRLIVSNAARRANSVNYLLLSEPEYNIKEFIPNLYVDITPYFDEKIKSLKFHRKENLKYYFKREYLETKSNWWSMQIENYNKKPKKYFETFQIIFKKLNLSKKICHLIVGFSIFDYFKNLLISTLELDKISDIIVITTVDPKLFGWNWVIRLSVRRK